MKRLIRKKALPTLLALAMVFSLLTAVPLTASAAANANQLAGYINNFAHGGRGNLETSVTGNTLTVTGTVTGAKEQMTLIIAAGYTILWKAEYSGDVGLNCLIDLGGEGTFEIPEGGNVTCTGRGTVLRASNTTYPITINVTGGTVKSVSGNCIDFRNGSLNISAGKVFSNYSRAIDVYADGTGKLSITGGMVYSTNDNAIGTLGTGSQAGGITVSGGCVFGVGTTVSDSNTGVIRMAGGKTPSVSGAAVVCGWHKQAGKTSYEVTKTEDLIANAGTVRWALDDGEVGVSYTRTAVNTTNRGFIPVPGITLTGLVAPTPPDERYLSITLAEGYAAMVIDDTGATGAHINVSGTPWPTITKVSGDSRITLHQNSDRVLNIATGLAVGTYPVVLKASNGVSPDATFTFTVNVIKGIDPVITKQPPDVIITPLTERHPAGDQEAFAVNFTIEATGNPLFYRWQIYREDTAAWEDQTNTTSFWSGGNTATLYYNLIDDPEWWLYKDVPHRCIVSNGVTSVTSETVKWTFGDPVAPTITGPAALSLSPGYEATATDAFTLAGLPAPEVTKTSGDAKITWNAETKKLDIAAGLAKGEYVVKLKAANGAPPDAEHTFTLTVGDKAAPKITGPATMTLEEGYAKASSAVFTIEGLPEPEVTKASGDAKITWNDETKKLDIAEGLETGTYVVKLKAANEVEPDAEFTFTLTVGDVPSPMDNFTKINTYIRGQFPDVDETLWYGYDVQKTIALAYEYGLMKGNADGTFNPNGNFKVVEALAVACRVHVIYSGGETLVESGNPWYQVYIEYAIANGMIKAGDFSDYERPATRAEMVYIFASAVPAEELPEVNTVKSLPDVDNGTPYSKEIFMMYEAGILTGNDDSGTFTPNANIIRAQAAAIIARVILPAIRTTGYTYG